MGCFFGCFRIKDSDRRQNCLFSDSVSSKSKDPLVSKNQLASFFLCEDNSSVCEDLSRPKHDNFDEELKDEAKFLKACGTLLQTPAEIRKTSVQAHRSPLKHYVEQSGSPEHSKFTRSPNRSGFGSAETLLETPVHSDNRSSLPSVNPQLPVSNIKCESKCVRFECVKQDSIVDLDTDSVCLGSSSPYNNDSQGPKQPFYPANFENFAIQKNGSIWSQYPYPALNQQSSLPVDSSLSHWFKPVNDERSRNCGPVSNGNSRSSKSIDSDRPIIGTVATHWNDDEPTHMSPKWWDGNGIPNSTNKYKEDQKVSWHATPFEERLEKALSDENLLPQRKLGHGKPIKFEESEESDTAAS